MAIQHIEIGTPFFRIELIQDEPTFQVEGKVILLNLSTNPIKIEQQSIEQFRSIVAIDTLLESVEHAVIVRDFDVYPDTDALIEEVKNHWPSAYDIRKEERLRGVCHHMSPKIWVGQIGLTLYCSWSVPLKVGLHSQHDFCPVPGFREVHTQIIGLGKMQSCREKDIRTLYLEDVMAPGVTHRPMCDEQGNYPWHQFETITPSIFMAVEMLPPGANPPSSAGEAA